MKFAQGLSFLLLSFINSSHGLPSALPTEPQPAETKHTSKSRTSDAISETSLAPSELYNLLTPPSSCTDSLDPTVCAAWARDINAHNLTANLTALWFGNPPDWPTRLTGIALPPDLGLSMNASDFMPVAEVNFLPCHVGGSRKHCKGGQEFCCAMVPLVWAFLGCCLVDCNNCHN